MRIKHVKINNKSNDFIAGSDAVSIAEHKIVGLQDQINHNIDISTSKTGSGNYSLTRFLDK